MNDGTALINVDTNSTLIEEAYEEKQLEDLVIKS